MSHVHRCGNPRRESKREDTRRESQNGSPSLAAIRREDILLPTGRMTTLVAPRWDAPSSHSAIDAAPPIREKWLGPLLNIDTRWGYSPCARKTENFPLDYMMIFHAALLHNVRFPNVP